MGTINDLFNGEIRPFETGYRNTDYSKSNMLQQRLYARLEKVLPEEEHETLRKFRLELENMIHEHGQELFAIGFSFGVRITAEGFIKSSD